MKKAKAIEVDLSFGLGHLVLRTFYLVRCQSSNSTDHAQRLLTIELSIKH